VTREGLPRREYRWAQLLLAVIPGGVLHAFFTVIGLTLKENSPRTPKTEGNAPLIVLFHWEFPITLSAQKTWRDQFRGVGFLGIHNWISYVTSVLCYLDALPAVRYDRRSGKKPFQQVMEFLRKNPTKAFSLRTDSGGPYNRVRTSVVTMALESHRPIVCVRQSADRTWRAWDHYIPKPFAHITTRIADPVLPETLRALSREDATAHVQAVMDQLEEKPGE